jgi:hypothetical protein
MVWDFGVRVEDWIQGLGFKVEGLGLRVAG